MKEAAGEANMTVITIVLIAIVLAIGTVVVNRMMDSTAKKQACSEIGGTLKNGVCNYINESGKLKSCTPRKCGNTNAYYCGSVVSCPSAN